MAGKYDYDIYMSIIDGVEKNIRDTFLNEVGNENLLKDFIAQWKEKFLKNKVVEPGKYSTWCTSKGAMKNNSKSMDNIQANQKSKQSSFQVLYNMRLTQPKSDIQHLKMGKEQEDKDIHKGLLALMKQPTKPIPNIKIIVQPANINPNPVHTMNTQPVKRPYSFSDGPPITNQRTIIVLKPDLNTPLRPLYQNQQQDQRLKPQMMLQPRVPLQHIKRSATPSFNTTNAQDLQYMPQQQQRVIIHPLSQMPLQHLRGTLPQQQQQQQMIAQQQQQMIAQQQQQQMIAQQQQQQISMQHQINPPQPLRTQQQQHRMPLQWQHQIPKQQLQQTSHQQQPPIKIIRVPNPNHPPANVPTKYRAIAPAPPKVSQQHFTLNVGVGPAAFSHFTVPPGQPNVNNNNSSQHDERNLRLGQYDGPMFMDDEWDDSDDDDDKMEDDMDLHYSDSNEVEPEDTTAVTDIDSVVMPTKEDIEDMFECDNVMTCFYSNLKMKKGRLAIEFHHGIISALKKEKIFGFAKGSFLGKD